MPDSARSRFRTLLQHPEITHRTQRYACLCLPSFASDSLNKSPFYRGCAPPAAAAAAARSRRAALLPPSPARPAGPVRAGSKHQLSSCFRVAGCDVYHCVFEKAKRAKKGSLFVSKHFGSFIAEDTPEHDPSMNSAVPPAHDF